MKIGIRTRVFLVTLGLTCVIGLAAGAVLEIRLRAALVDRVEEHLRNANDAVHRARLAAEQVEAESKFKVEDLSKVADVDPHVQEE